MSASTAVGSPTPESEGVASPTEEEGAAESTPEAESSPSWWAVVRVAYFVFDRRALGFTRILLGFMLLMDLFHRGRVWFDMYSSIGVLPTHVNLQRPLAWGAWSLFNAFENPPELVALWCAMFVTYSCLLLGYRTKLAQILSMVFVVSMNGRVLLIENGGYVVHNLLCMWTCFLPLGDRFSLDSMLESMRRRREATDADLNDRSPLVPEHKLAPHVSILGLVLCFQIGAIYFFNFMHKTGPAWHNGTAVHFVLYVDRMVTPIVGLIRDYIPNWGIIILTRMTIAFELAIPFMIFSPLFKAWCRRAAIVMINTLHIGFGTFMVLGPFAWACCIFSTLLFTRDDWEIAIQSMRRTHRARVLVYDGSSGAALWFCRIVARLDRYELLTFRAGGDVPTGLATEDADGARCTRSAALAEIVDAIPLGPCIAWIVRLPGVRQLVDAAMRRCEGGWASRTFGLRLPTRSASLPARTALGNARSWVYATFRELLILAMFAGAVNQAAVELWVINRRFKVPQPEPTRLLALKLRFLQGWFMFSPNPVMDDGTLVVDAVTVDGRHIDPFTQEAPSFELLNVKSYGYSQIWCDYYNRIHLPANSAYREAMKDYMYRLPERTKNPNDKIQYGDVYWIQDLNPRWNSTKSYQYEKQKLFSFEAPGVKRPPGSEPPAPPPPPKPPVAALPSPTGPRIHLPPPSGSAAPTEPPAPAPSASEP